MLRKLSVLCVCVLVFSCLATKAQIPIYQNSIYTFETRLNHLLDSMNTEQKLAQLLVLGSRHHHHILKNDTVFSSYGMIKQYPEGLGTISLSTNLLGGLSPQKLHYFTKEVQQHSTARSLRIPVLFTDDAFSPSDSLPVGIPYPIALAATWNPAIVEKTASQLALHKRSLGIHALVGPIIAPITDPRNSELAISFGSQPHLSAALTRQWVQGLQGDLFSEQKTTTPDKVAAVLRLSETRQPKASAEQLFTTPQFVQAYSEILSAAQSSWGLIAAKGYLQGTPLHFHPWAWKEFLRKQLQFEGLLFANTQEVDYVSRLRVFPPERSPFLRALAAGIDMEFPVMEYPDTWKKEHLTYTRLDSASLAHRVANILNLKFRVGLFETDFHDSAYVATADWEERLATRRTFQKATEASIVMLKNDENLLPLTSEAKRIAVIGPLAEYTPMYFQHMPDSIVTLKEALLQEKTAAQTLSFARGIPSWFTEQENAHKNTTEALRKRYLNEALEIAKTADVLVIALGEPLNDTTFRKETDGYTDANLKLPALQQHLLESLAALQKPMVVLLFGTKPYTLHPVYNQIGALLHGWVPTLHTGVAIARILTGKIAPKGHLPFDYPKSVGHLALLNDASLGIHAEEEAHLFSVGHGLTYTHFAYDTLMLKHNKLSMGEHLEVALSLKNIGMRTGRKTIPLFVAKQNEWFGNEPKELKAFQTVELKNGAGETITFTLKAEDLQRVQPDGTWQQEAGIYDVFVYDEAGKRIAATFEIVPDSKPQGNTRTEAAKSAR